MKPILWMSDPLARALRERLSGEAVRVSTAAEFLAAPREDTTVSFIDGPSLATLDHVAEELGGELSPPGHVVAICDGTLQSAIGYLPSHPWLCHVVSSTMVQHAMSSEHLFNVVSTLSSERRPKLLDWVRSALTGRRVRLTRASRRVERLQKLGEFFEENGFSKRTVHVLRDAAEELLTNAFYDAPYAAGAVGAAIPRTEDVSLPEESACDLLYGVSGDLGVVRVRDPFGALSRSRIVQVLTRCARTDMQVEVDESMGGAGLGLWRIFAVASFVAISVVSQHHTDVLIGIGKKGAGGGAARPFAFHFFFTEGHTPRLWKTVQDSETKHSFVTAPTDSNADTDADADAR